MISLSSNYVFIVINLIIINATQAISLRQQITAGGTVSQTPKKARWLPSKCYSSTNKIVLP